MNTIQPDPWLYEISLGDSLEWVEKMNYAESRLDCCAQVGDAFPRWIRELYCEVG